MSKRTKPIKRGEAGEVFRQFAWNLAGTLARPAGKERPAAQGGQRRDSGR